ncbi:RNA-binding protein NOB1 [Trichogramma pretiosum]|uniref:RNA-binding protein NOB1 n=1 Tax=Trichogramma pretiosum TaxID=7493 RepID=UPI0006C945B0|nr:RNA-binding protein NOB1 [Trichogramma pretiosum]
MDDNNKVKFLIVDTSAFIKNAQLQDIGETIITEPSVIDEIKSKRQLKRLVVLPYDLEVNEPFPEDVHFVTEFSKKTGDYASLSATDIRVMALTYRYERERVGVDHLKTEPERKKQIIDSSIRNHNNAPKNVIPSSKSDSDDTKTSNSAIEENNESPANAIIESSENGSENIEEPNSTLEEKNESSDETPKTVISDDSDSNESSGSESEYDEEASDSEDTDDDSGWITPSNIKEVTKQMNCTAVKEKAATVACLTMDFAMQNVLMQIGLNVASLDGKVIKHMRTFIMRCHACFKTTPNVTKVFCPHCGNKTLKKVAVSIDDEGKQKIHINFRKKLSTKGKRFSLPTMQGGKHACNPILCEDQPVPDQRPTKLGRKINDPLNEDYIAGYSPFVLHDVNSRAAMLGIRGNTGLKHWQRRNPNQPMKNRKK